MGKARAYGPSLLTFQHALNGAAYRCSSGVQAMSDYNVGDLVAEFLALCGVSTVFGVVSVHNIPMLDGIGRRNAIRYVMARGELGAGHMADGYARVTGGLGVLFSSTGPGDDAIDICPGKIMMIGKGERCDHRTAKTQLTCE